MRLRGTISHSGLNLLATCVLPTLEKFGKHCVLFASPEMLHFIQKSLDTDGMQVIVSVPGVMMLSHHTTPPQLKLRYCLPLNLCSQLTISVALCTRLGC